MRQVVVQHSGVRLREVLHLLYFFLRYLQQQLSTQYLPSLDCADRRVIHYVLQLSPAQSFRCSRYSYQLVFSHVVMFHPQMNP